MKLGFTKASDAGKHFAMKKTGSDLNNIAAEEVIFEAMKENPFKGEKARRDFVEGASTYVNLREERRNRRMNGE